MSLRTRAAAHPAFTPNLGEQITRLCVDHAPVLGAAVVDVATQAEQPEPLIEALLRVVHDSNTPADTFSKLSDALPRFSHRLAEFAVDLTHRNVATYRALVEQDSDAFLPGLAVSLNNQFNRLSDLGRVEEALEAITEAVGILEQLAELRPAVHQAELEQSLEVRDWIKGLRVGA